MKPLQEKLGQIAPELQALHEKLVSIRRSIKGCEARTKVGFSPGFHASITNGYFQFATHDVSEFKQQLAEIEASRVDGKFLAPDGSEPLGQEIVLELLARCQSLADEALERLGS